MTGVNELTDQQLEEKARLVAMGIGNGLEEVALELGRMYQDDWVHVLSVGIANALIEKQDELAARGEMDEDFDLAGAVGDVVAELPGM